MSLRLARRRGLQQRLRRDVQSHQLGQRMRTRLAHHARAMDLDGLRAQMQPCGHFLVGGTLDHELHDLAFARRELREPSLEFGLALVQIGLIVAAAVGWLGYRQPFAYPTVLIFTDPMVLPRLDSFSYDWSPVYALLIVAVSLTGIGWIVIGDRLSAAHSSLHGLGVLLRTVMLVNGLGLIGSGLLLTLGNLAALAPIALLVGITGVTRQALMTLLFFRAARRASRRPAGGLFA